MNATKTPPFDTLPPAEFEVPDSPYHVRRINKDDADNILKLVQDDAVRQYVPWAKSVTDYSSAVEIITQFEGAWDRKVIATYVVEQDGEFVGYCRMWRDQKPGYYEIGTGLLPDVRKSGIGTKLVTELMRMAKDNLGSKGMVAYVHETNTASRAAVKKLGFKPTDELDDGDRRYTLDFS